MGQAAREGDEHGDMQMKIPQAIRKQVIEYEKAGFHPVSIEARNGAHFKITFAEFPDPQFITKNADEWRSLKNNIARYRQLKREHEEKA